MTDTATPSLPMLYAMVQLVVESDGSREVTWDARTGVCVDVPGCSISADFRSSESVDEIMVDVRH